MKTIEQIRKYAIGLAEGHFYSDEGIPWEPFEDWPKADIEAEVENLAAAIEGAMLWAQGKAK
jgi:hypothetical protein